MVEYTQGLNLIFFALSDATRRSILDLLAKTDLTISEIADNYKLTFAAISKHIKILEKANLVTKKREGKHQIVTITPITLDIAKEHIERYSNNWTNRFDKLEEILKS